MQPKPLSDVSRETAKIICDAKLIVVLRHIPLEGLREAATALQKSDIRAVEVAMNSTHAVEQLRVLKECGFCVGAGTILCEGEAEKAVDAGAEFLFSPVRISFLPSFCRKHKVLGIPGAFSPTEIHLLCQEGYELVKLFPAASLGPEYLRQILAPFPALHLVPTGGVTLSRANQFLRCGAAALAVGTEILSRSLVQAKRFDLVAERAHSFVTLIDKFRGGNLSLGE